ncbi:unnamed protein product [Prorocentrum cordatum]|uniref:Uncharacterized protein n=1 Tax=Prorocentrum cordatum TaxID=2364126 RepID=A0ABN9RH05_9DINO|nr:unnamed protein product [Polarella glacialis]
MHVQGTLACQAAERLNSSLAGSQSAAELACCTGRAMKDRNGCWGGGGRMHSAECPAPGTRALRCSGSSARRAAAGGAGRAGPPRLAGATAGAPKAAQASSSEEPPRPSRRLWRSDARSTLLGAKSAPSHRLPGADGRGWTL